MRPARSHFDDGPALGSADDAGSGCRDSRVVVEDREDKGLEEDSLAETRLDREHRATGEEALPFDIGVDVT